jgi:hypothetical protein
VLLLVIAAGAAGIAIGARFAHPLAGVLGALALFITAATNHLASGGGIWLLPWEVLQDDLSQLPGPLPGYPPAGAHALTPVPAWVAPAGHLLLAVPVLAVTCWAQLLIMAHTVPPRTVGHPPAVYAVIAQLTGWCAITVACAAWVDRSRYADLGGAVAIPVSFAAIALAWYAPVTSRFLTGPPASALGVTSAWYAIAAAALTLAGAAMTDRWHRYSRHLRVERGF